MTDLATQNVETWIREFIVVCKNFAAKKNLKIGEGEYEILKSFTKPFQIVAIKVKGEPCILLVIHDEKKLDQEIILYETEDHNEVSSIFDHEILNKDYFQTTPEIAVSYAAWIGDLLSIEGRRERISWVRFLNGGRNDFLLMLNIESLSKKPSEVVTNWLKNSEQKEKEFSLEDLKNKGVKIGTAIGGLWHPPIVVEGIPVLLSKSKIADVSYKRRKVLLYNNGVIAVIVSKKRWNYFEKPRKIAIEILNEIIGTANLFDVRGISFTDEDLISYDVRFDTMEIGSGFFSVEFTPRSLISRSSRCDFSPHFHKSVLTVNREKILQIIAVSKKANANSRIKNYIATYLDAVTHFYLSEYKASFLLGWILLEKYVDAVWFEMLEENKVSKKRCKKLTGIFWSADDIIECLNLVGKVTKGRYAEFMYLKKLRNDILHSDKLVHSKDSERVLGLCKKVILKMINNIAP